MSRLTHPDLFELSTDTALRKRRNDLLRKADKSRYRLHQKPELSRELQRTTSDLLRLELQKKTDRKLEALGDVKPQAQRLPYKD